jgi:hypothetical protein
MIDKGDYVIAKKSLEVPITIYPHGRVYKREYDDCAEEWWIYFKSDYGLFAMPEHQISKLDNDYYKYRW